MALTPEPERRATMRRQSARPGGRRADDPPADWVSVTIYAQRYGVDRTTVYKWLDAGILETYRVDTLLRIRNRPPNQHRPPVSTPVDGC